MKFSPDDCIIEEGTHEVRGFGIFGARVIVPEAIVQQQRALVVPDVMAKFRECTGDLGLTSFPQLDNLDPSQSNDVFDPKRVKRNPCQHLHSDYAYTREAGKSLRELVSFWLHEGRFPLGTLAIPKRNYNSPYIHDSIRSLVKRHCAGAKINAYRQHMGVILERKLGIIINTEPGLNILPNDDTLHARCFTDFDNQDVEAVATMYSYIAIKDLPNCN